MDPGGVPEDDDYQGRDDRRRQLRDDMADVLVALSLPRRSTAVPTAGL
jgi:hypothetical protein